MNDFIYLWIISSIFQNRSLSSTVVHGDQWTQAARGVAGRANVKLCFASRTCVLLAHVSVTMVAVRLLLKLFRYTSRDISGLLSCKVGYMSNYGLSFGCWSRGRWSWSWSCKMVILTSLTYIEIHVGLMYSHLGNKCWFYLVSKGAYSMYSMIIS